MNIRYYSFYLRSVVRLKLKMVMICFMILCFASSGSVLSASFVVDNLGDTDNGLAYTFNDGTNTIRKCIRLANNNAGSDTINFSVSGTSFVSSLPEITNSGTVIDASSRWSGVWPAGSPGVNVDGGTDIYNCFVINGASNCAIRGLFITNFDNGIIIKGGAQNNVIGGTTVGSRNIISGNYVGVSIYGVGTNSNQVSGNYIGTNSAGDSALGNTDGVCIFDNAQSNVIGGATSGSGNVISGNGNVGVNIYDSGTNYNQVKGNYIGTNSADNTAIGNWWDGVFISNGAKNNVIGGTTAGERNVISGNGDTGVHIFDSGTDNNQVKGNYIGTNSAGDAIIGNGLDGVGILFDAQNNTIGGTTTSERNVISGNGSSGVYISSNNNQVKGNYIGTNSAGNSALGNSDYGVLIMNDGNIIGGTTVGERNIISGNGKHGVYIAYSAISNQIIGNYIGTNSGGTSALGNTKNGVFIFYGAQYNVIGGSTVNHGNKIAYNGEDGINIEGVNTRFNTISHNSIYNNIELGIDLVNGGNDEISAPVATSALTGNSLSLTGSGAGANATVEVFKADNATSAEGMTYLGSLTANGSGNFTGAIDVTGKGVSANDAIVINTTHTNGNTSEFRLTIVQSLITAKTTPPASANIWNIVGPSVITLDKSIVNNFGLGFGTTWIAWRWNPTLARWEAPATLGSNPVTSDPFDAGTSWFYALDGDGSYINKSVQGTTVDISTSFSVPLKMGWNMICNPFNFSVAWSDSIIKIKYGVWEGTPTQAQSAGYVDNRAIWYNPDSRAYVTRYSYEATPYVMPKTRGQWLYSAVNNAYVVFPPTEYTGSPVPPSKPQHDSSLWKIELTLISSKGKDIIEAIADNKKQVNLNDLKAPSLPILTSNICFIRDDNMLSSDRQKESSEMIWTFEVTTSEESLIRWKLIEVPGDYRLTLEDETGGQIDIRQANSLPIGKTEKGRYILSALRILVPKATRLLTNYPNPFNPDTWIPYELSEGSEVVVRIYTSGGQLVRTLNLGHKEAGYYVTKDRSAHWDGCNESGEKAVSGIYFYMIKADKFTATRKMIIQN